MKWLKKIILGSIEAAVIVGILFAGFVAAGWLLNLEPPMSVAAEGEENHDDHDDHEGGDHDDHEGGEHEDHDDHDDHDDHEGGEHGEDEAELNVEQMKKAGVVIETATDAVLTKTIALNGMITPNQEALVHVVPRFPGIIASIEKSIGEVADKDEVLIRIESNESLNTYEIRSPIAGTIIERDATLGEFVDENDRLLVVANLDTVWIDFRVYQRDFDRIELGQSVHVSLSSGEKVAVGTISYISPFGSADTQSMLARVVAANDDGKLRPGLFVTGRVQLSPKEVSVAVKETAIQYLDGEPVVFVQDGEEFIARDIMIGYRDGSHVEVLSGVQMGEMYVSENSFLLKAELGKGLAEHEH